MNYQALQNLGFTPQQIVQYISKAFPQLGQKLQAATTAGYSTEQVVKLLGKLDLKGLNQANQAPKGQTDLQRARQASREGGPEAKVLTKLAKVAGTVALGYAAGRLIPQAAQAAGALLGGGQTPPPTGPATPPTNPAGQPIATNGPGLSANGFPLPQPPPGSPPVVPPNTPSNPASQTALQHAIPKNVQQAAPGIIAQGQTPPPVNNEPQQQMPITQQPAANFVEANAPELHQLIQNLQKNGKDPLTTFATSKVLNQRFGNTIKKLEKQSGKNFFDILQESYGSQAQAQNQTSLQAPTIPSNTPQSKVQTPTNETISEVQTTPKSTHAVTPSGNFGQIKSIKDGIATIDVDGVEKRFKADDLVESPIPEKELAGLYNELKSEIEKTTGQQMSRNVDFAGYDPDARELAYRPHLGDLYTYEDISPEEAEVLTSVLTQRITSGKNFIGAWESGTDSPIGAALSALLKKIKARPRKEGEKDYKRKFKTVYGSTDIAKQASKQKEREDEKRKKNKK